MKVLLASLLVTISLAAPTCSPKNLTSALQGHWALYDQKGGFRIQPHPMPVMVLEFSGTSYKKFVDQREVESGSWAISEETFSGDTLRARISLKNLNGEEHHKIRPIGKDAFVLDEDAPAYDGVAWWYRRESN